MLCDDDDDWGPGPSRLLFLRHWITPPMKEALSTSTAPSRSRTDQECWHQWPGLRDNPLVGRLTARREAMSLERCPYDHPSTPSHRT